MNYSLIRHKIFLTLFSVFLVLINNSCENSESQNNILPDSSWEESRWISVADAPIIRGKVSEGVRSADGANWFVTTVKNSKNVVSAKWMATSLGIFELFVNERLIGDEILKPGFTHPYKTKYAYSYDITETIKRNKNCENVFAAQVTPGWWADKIITPKDHFGMVGNKCAFRSVIHLVYDDGSTEIIGTHPRTWLAGIAGPVKHASIYDGEIYDAREPQGYKCISKLQPAEFNYEFSGDILPASGAQIYQRHDLILKPIASYVWRGVEGATSEEFGKVIIRKDLTPWQPIILKKGETLIVDFGQNCAAVPVFTFKAKGGTTLRCETAEILNDGNGSKSRGMDGPEGSIHRLNLRIPESGMFLEYTFADSVTPMSYIPRATYFGYRYISVTVDDDVEIQSIESLPISSITNDNEIGEISTGNELINKLISNTIWSMRSNYLSVPTDCPQRNERLGWTADAQVFAATGSFFANTGAFFHKWMRDMRDSQHPLGGFPGVAPLAQYGNEMSRIGWSDAGVIVPWNIWKQFADSSIINDNWEAMSRWMNRINKTKYDHYELREDNCNYQYADWLSYEPLESSSGDIFDSSGIKTEAIDYWDYLGGCYWLADAEMMEDMATALGKVAEAKKYARIKEEAKRYIIDKFINVDGTFKNEILNTMQTPALFALKHGLVSSLAKDNMIKRLRANFAKNENCLSTGFLGTSILMSTLTANGMSDIAYDLLFQTKNPSWIYSINNGATTIWERWDSYTNSLGLGPKGMNSFNHYAYGCVCQWLWETAAGISSDISIPGFRHIILAPIPDKRLKNINAQYKSSAGIIKSSWRYEDDDWIWTFTIPEGAIATVTVPGEETSYEYTSGTYTVAKNMK